MNDLTVILKPEPNKLADVRKLDSETGTVIADICDYVLRNDYRHAAQATAYLLVVMAKKSGLKPFAILRNITR